MKALERLSDRSLAALVAATNWPGPSPAQKAAPRWWSHFADCVAVEVAHRHGMDDVREPALPRLEAAELELAGASMLGMATACDDDPEQAAALREIAAGLAAVRELQDATATSH